MRKIVIGFGATSIVVSLLRLHGKTIPTGWMEESTDQFERSKMFLPTKSDLFTSAPWSTDSSRRERQSHAQQQQQSTINSTLLLSDALDPVVAENCNVESAFKDDITSIKSHTGWLQSLPLLPQINKNCTVVFQEPNLHLCRSSSQLLDQVALQVTLRLLEYHFQCLTDDSLRIVDLDDTNNNSQRCFNVRPRSDDDANKHHQYWSHRDGIFLLPFLYPGLNTRPTYTGRPQSCIFGKVRKLTRSIKFDLDNMMHDDWRTVYYDQLVYCDLIATMHPEGLVIADSMGIPAVSLFTNLSSMHNTIRIRDVYNNKLYPPRIKPFRTLQTKLDYKRAEPIAQSFPFHLFTTKKTVGDYKPTSEKNRTLVIVIGSLRGGEGAWQSMYKHLLDVNMADLALMVGASNNKTNNTASPYHRAKYVWEFPEYTEWADAIDTIAGGPGWRETFVWNRNGGLLGPVFGTRGSGAIIFMARYWVLQRINELNLRDRYDRFVVTRSDFYYKCAQDLSQYDERYVWVPSEEDWGGITDRQVISPAGLIDKVLNILPPLLQHPERYYKTRLQTTPEGQIWLQWTMEGIYPHHIRRFPMTMYTCAVDGDTSRWQGANIKRGVTNDGVYVKYEAEYEFSSCFCGGGTVTDQSKLSNWTYTDARQVLQCTSGQPVNESRT